MFDNTSQSRDNTPYIPITTVLTKSSTKVPAIEQFDFTTFHLMISYANPSISLVCLILNITSVTVFIKSGLRKPANVFLCTLSISDIMSNGLTLNFARALRYFDAAKKYPGIFAWEYHYEFSYMMYLCERLSDFFGYWGMYVQRTVPVILTIDRILAVYWPLHFRRWITFKSSCFISAGVFFLWLPWMLFSQSIFEFWYIEVKNLHFGSKVESPVFLNNETIIFIFNAYIIEILSSWIPATLVIAGCIAVGVKVKMTLRKRQQLTTERIKWSTKTTRALVSVSLFFAVSQFIYQIIVNVFIQDVSSASFAIYNFTEFTKLDASINNICNFLVYVLFNEKFRKTLFGNICKIN